MFTLTDISLLRFARAVAAGGRHYRHAASQETRQEPIRNPIDCALFISFFPQLVAGPIVRPLEFFADLYHWRKPSSDEALHGTLLILLGLAKKMVMAAGTFPSHGGCGTTCTFRSVATGTAG